MSGSHTIKLECYLDLVVEVEGTPVPFVPGVMTLRNGDPGYPDEGGYVEDVYVYLVRKDKSGEEVKLDITDFVPKRDMARFEQGILEQADDDAEEDEYRRLEARAEAKAERERESDYE